MAFPRSHSEVEQSLDQVSFTQVSVVPVDLENPSLRHLSQLNYY